MSRIRETFLPFALPKISEKAIAEVSEVLRSGWITSGPKVKEFEDKFAEFVGSPFTLAVNSATAGLHLALEAIGLTDSDAIVAPSVTFTATTEVACYFGAEPILTDVDPVNHLMTPDTLMDAFEKFCELKNGSLVHKSTQKKVRAIMPVHLAGHTCDMEGLLRIARKFDLYVIEDAAHAFPATHKGKAIGNWGDFTVFSFYATKGITTGEGGMVTTHHGGMLERMRLMRLHGINRDAYDRPGWYYEVVSPGFKYNLSDMAAALGIVQLEEAQELWERRVEIAKVYSDAFRSFPGVHLPQGDPNGEHSWHLYRICIESEEAGIDRDRFAQALRERNIGSSLHFIPIFEHPFYKNRFHMKAVDFPNAAKMYAETLSLPLFPAMTDSDVRDVVDSVVDVMENVALRKSA